MSSDIHLSVNLLISTGTEGILFSSSENASDELKNALIRGSIMVSNSFLLKLLLDIHSESNE